MSLVQKYSQDTQIWFISDLHLNHQKQFIWQSRGFTNIQEHNQTILNNIKECVRDNDEFYILGDLTLGPIEEVKEILRQLPGRIHVILGNHDTDRRIEFYQSLGWDVQFSTVIRWEKYRFYLSHYPTITGNTDEELRAATFCIYGHTHSKTAWDARLPLAYNVAPEANNNRPVSISDIVTILVTSNIFHKNENT